MHTSAWQFSLDVLMLISACFGFSTEDPMIQISAFRFPARSGLIAWGWSVPLVFLGFLDLYPLVDICWSVPLFSLQKPVTDHLEIWSVPCFISIFLICTSSLSIWGKQGTDHLICTPYYVIFLDLYPLWRGTDQEIWDKAGYRSRDPYSWLA